MTVVYSCVQIRLLRFFKEEKVKRELESLPAPCSVKGHGGGGVQGKARSDFPSGLDFSPQHDYFFFSQCHPDELGLRCCSLGNPSCFLISTIVSQSQLLRQPFPDMKCPKRFSIRKLPSTFMSRSSINMNIFLKIPLEMCEAVFTWKPL